MLYTEIKIDVTTLPNDGERVEYETVDEVIRKGVYVASEQMFKEEGKRGAMDFAWRVVQWRPLDIVLEKIVKEMDTQHHPTNE